MGEKSAAKGGTRCTYLEEAGEAGGKLRYTTRAEGIRAENGEAVGVETTYTERQRQQNSASSSRRPPWWPPRARWGPRCFSSGGASGVPPRRRRVRLPPARLAGGVCGAPEPGGGAPVGGGIEGGEGEEGPGGNVGNGEHPPRGFSTPVFPGEGGGGKRNPPQILGPSPGGVFIVEDRGGGRSRATKKVSPHTGTRSATSSIGVISGGPGGRRSACRRRRGRKRSSSRADPLRRGSAARTSRRSSRRSTRSRSAPVARRYSVPIRCAARSLAATRRRASRNPMASCTTRPGYGSRTPAGCPAAPGSTRWCLSWPWRAARRRTC